MTPDKARKLQAAWTVLAVLGLLVWAPLWAFDVDSDLRWLVSSASLLCTVRATEHRGWRRGHKAARMVRR